jgi:hypothetical protein
MAVGTEGTEAAAAGYPIVPDSGEDGRVRWGAREINRTRDFVAQLKKVIPSGKGGFRTSSGITSSTSIPSNTVGNDGDIHFKIV